MLSIAILKAQFLLVVPFNYSEPPAKALTGSFRLNFTQKMTQLILVSLDMIMSARTDMAC
jgi:hypothetical protein